MIRNILVPTDFSHDAYNALFYATQLYKQQKCTFHILHAYDRQSYFKEEYPGRRSGKTLIEFLSDRTAECLRETYHRIISDTEKNPLHTFITIPRNSYLAKGIKDYVKQTPIDLLVMGNKGRTGTKEVFLGGNTIEIIKNGIACPVLCVPREIDYRPISQIAYITDFEHAIDEHALDIVKSLALTNEASLHILHICKDEELNMFQEKNKEFLGNYFEDVCLRFHTAPYKKSKAKTVASFVEERGIDFLTMCYYRHYFLDRLFREPVVLDVSFYLEIPFLVIPDQD